MTFPRAARDQLGLRAGHRCSLCRRLTCRPHPENPEEGVNLGHAAHITAEKEGGPRYDPTLTTQERASLRNGIWLCDSCGRLVDAADSAYTVEFLQERKFQAEAIAAREASYTVDQLGDLIPELDAVALQVRLFASVMMDLTTRPLYNQMAPPKELDPDLAEAVRNVAHQANTLRMLNVSTERRSVFARYISPRVAAVLEQAAAALGSDHPVLRDHEFWVSMGETNDLGAQDLADNLGAVARALAMR